MIGWIFLTALLLFAAVVTVRTLRFTPKPQPVLSDESVEFDKAAAVDALSQLVRCRTVSYNDPAMEDNALDIIIGKGPAARSIRIDLPKFTLIGATTRAGQLTTPLRDRFGVVLKLELYTPEELAMIVKRSSGILGYNITDDGAYEIASRSRGTPRIANRLLKRVRDFAQVQGKEQIDSAIANYALQRLEIDQLGLDDTDRRMLQTIIKIYDGGPVGLETLAATLGEEAITLEDVYEPYLMQIGYLSRTPRGRCVTRLAYEHLGLPFTDRNTANPVQINIFSSSEEE